MMPSRVLPSCTWLSPTSHLQGRCRVIYAASRRHSSLGSGGGLVVEVEQRVDVRDQRGGLGGAHAEQHVAACDQQLVAQLELLGEVGRAVHEQATVEGKLAAP